MPPQPISPTRIRSLAPSVFPGAGAALAIRLSPASKVEPAAAPAVIDSVRNWRRLFRFIKASCLFGCVCPITSKIALFAAEFQSRFGHRTTETRRNLCVSVAEDLTLKNHKVVAKPSVRESDSDLVEHLFLLLPQSVCEPHFVNVGIAQAPVAFVKMRQLLFAPRADKIERGEFADDLAPLHDIGQDLHTVAAVEFLAAEWIVGIDDQNPGMAYILRSLRQGICLHVALIVVEAPHLLDSRIGHFL